MGDMDGVNPAVVDSLRSIAEVAIVDDFVSFA